MGSSEKVEWEEAARCDMARYEREKAEYDGPGRFDLINANPRTLQVPRNPSQLTSRSPMSGGKW